MAKRFPEDLTELSIEALMNLQVTTVAKKEQTLADAAAAVFVISSDDIRRSGATNIPELLRMVPGLEVAGIDANKWAVSSRGFNGRFANKLLVLIDGRSVYSPTFSGVFWNVQDVLLEDLDRIEVIRGPGAALWGSNAVNGVINVITKSARETVGGFVEAGAGSEERAFGAVRYGGKLGESLYYRAYAKYFDRDQSYSGTGSDPNDGWDSIRSGFRMDWDFDVENYFTLQGDIYDGHFGDKAFLTALTPPYSREVAEDLDFAGGNLLGRWKHDIDAGSYMELQAYYDRTERVAPLFYTERRDTFDLEFEHRFPFQRRHELQWGLGYRLISDKIISTENLSFDPASRKTQLFSAFIHDEITLIKDSLRVTLGSKFEHNDFTGFEIQPNVRLIWKPRPFHTLWGAVSRAVRTPSRSEHDVRYNQRVIPTLPSMPPILVAFMGDEDFESEELVSYELGYRLQLEKRFFFDLALFYNFYSNLRTIEPALDRGFSEENPPPPHQVLPALPYNRMDGQTYGIELAAECRVLDWWRLYPAYTYLRMNLDLDPNSQDSISLSAEGESPEHQFSLRSSMDLPLNLELDVWFRYVDRLPAQDLDSYITMDARLAWKFNKSLEFAVVGQNLLEPHHPEFKPEFQDIAHTEVERGVYGKIIWRF